jgi:hypothetical protein
MADNATMISPRGFRVLNRMCWHAMDNARGDTPAHIYFGGWGPLALLFPTLSPLGQETAVARAIRELVNAGLIKPIGTAARGHRQHYEITL